MPEVSIIVPNYNHAEYLPQRLNSIFNQTYKDYEVILLDDASSDNSVEILKQHASHPKVSHFIVNKKNSGSTFKQWEKGLKLAKGIYIWIAESDDIAHPDFLYKTIEQFDNNDNISVVCVGSSFINENDIIIEDQSIYNKYINRSGIKEIKEKLIYYNTIQNASAVLFKRNTYLKSIKNFTNFSYCGDWYFWSKILLTGNIIFLPEKLNLFRRHSNNVSFNAEKNGLLFKEGFQIFIELINKKDIGFTKKEKNKIWNDWSNRFISYVNTNNSNLSERLHYICIFLFNNPKAGFNIIKYIIANYKYHLLKKN